MLSSWDGYAFGVENDMDVNKTVVETFTLNISELFST